MFGRFIDKTQFLHENVIFSASHATNKSKAKRKSVFAINHVTIASLSWPEQQAKKSYIDVPADTCCYCFTDSGFTPS